MGAAELHQSLLQFNTHWWTGTVSPLVRRSTHKRRTFGYLRQRVRELPFEVLAGPRQVGKTTLAGHVMEDLLSDTAPERILYALLDAPQINLELGGTLTPLLAAYERFVLGGRIEEQDGPIYLFLDEIHALPKWDTELKSLYDRYHPWMRVLATGSSSAALVNAPTADFAGRVYRSKLYPLKFSETLELVSPRSRHAVEAARRVRQAVDWSASPDDVRSSLRLAVERAYVAAMKNPNDVEQAWQTYLRRGGYPAAQPPAADDEVYRFFETGMDTILAKDLSLYDGIRKTGSFRSLLAKLAKEHGSKFVASNVARDIGVDAGTPAQWLRVCEDVFLAQSLPQMNESFEPVPRKSEKVYIQDPGVLAFLAGNPPMDEMERSGRIGLVVEGVVFDHLRRLQFNAFGGRSGRVGYWPKPEVDFIVELPTMHLAVEVKLGESGTHRLRTMFGQRKDVLPVVATRSAFDLSKEVWLVPAWLLAMLS